MARESRTKVSVGIDLGTTYCCIAAYQHGRVVTINNTFSESTNPSYVSFEAVGDQVEHHYGRAAKYEETEDPSNTIFNVKRFIGRRYNDSVTQEEIHRLPFKVIDCNNHPRVRVTLQDKTYDYLPEEISGMLLVHLKKLAEDYLGAKVVDAVITVPANFNDAQKKATKAAGTLAGLNVLQLLNEPTAGAIAYGKNLTGSKTILVFDFGGGTLDVSVLKVLDGKEFEVKATAGDMYLGGEDIDEKLAQHCAQVFQETNGVDITDDAHAMKILRQHCENAKLCLSGQTQARIGIASLSGQLDFRTKISRGELEVVCADIFGKVLIPVKEALKQADLGAEDIDKVVLTGGSSKIPRVQELLRTIFPGKVLDQSINPDQAIAHGAAELAHSLSSTMSPLVLHDVTPLGLGIAAYMNAEPEELFSIIIPKNSKIPVSFTGKYTPRYRHATSVDIDVYEGEQRLAKENHFLGNYSLGGLKPNFPALEVTFTIDPSGILFTEAIEVKTGNKMEMTFSDDERFSKDEVDRMAQGMKRHEEHDQEHSEKLQARYQFERALAALDPAGFEDAASAKEKYEEIVQWHSENQGRTMTKSEYLGRAEILHNLASDYPMAVIKLILHSEC